MTAELRIGREDGISAIEQKLVALNAALDPPGQEDFLAYVAGDRRASFFKDIWSAMAVAGGTDRAREAHIVAWGRRDWSDIAEMDRFALSHPCIVALQRGATVTTDQAPRLELDPALVRRQITRSGGLIGEEGARFRTVVELDPELPRAAVLWRGLKARDAFLDFIRGALRDLEIGARAGGQRAPNPSRSAILEWLFELHANAYEHGRRNRSARLLRLEKHLYPDREAALAHAQHVPELMSYLEAQDERPSNRAFNLVEASVSDFGPGILDGFLATYAGQAFRTVERRELLERLLHDQLSSKSSDPNAGLGIRQALEAARELDAFVFLRTAEFSLCMRGRADERPALSFREGAFPSVTGTHWQLLLPDRNEAPGTRA